MSKCSTDGCNRTAAVRIPPPPLSQVRREFCHPCHRAWRRGAKTVFMNGVPRGERIEEAEADA